MQVNVKFIWAFECSGTTDWLQQSEVLHRVQTWQSDYLKLQFHASQCCEHIVQL